LGTDTLKELRTGWLYFPGLLEPQIKEIYPLEQPQIVVKLVTIFSSTHYIIHSVASSGQCDTPQNTIELPDGYMPIPLLQKGFKCPMAFCGTIHLDYSFDDDQILRFPNAFEYQHIIGSLYCIKTNSRYSPNIYLVDIEKKKIIRTLSNAGEGEIRDGCLMTGMLTRLSIDAHTDWLTIREYGAL
jgi:hypothetical protein